MEGRVLVTGAGSGIGRAVGRVLVQKKWEVVGADIEPSGDLVRLDVADEKDWERVLDEHWPLTAVVNCAGVRTRSPLVDVEVAEFDRLMAIHARGSFLAIRGPARRWLAEGSPGSVVTIASVNATHATAGQLHYVASKAAVGGVVRAAAAELASSGIRINALAPGIIRTPMTADKLGDAAQLEWFRRRVPAGRVGEAQEVAEAAAWLISDEARYVNGVLLPVDGGWAAT